MPDPHPGDPVPRTPPRRSGRSPGRGRPRRPARRGRRRPRRPCPRRARAAPAARRCPSPDHQETGSGPWVIAPRRAPAGPDRGGDRSSPARRRPEGGRAATTSAARQQVRRRPAARLPASSTQRPPARRGGQGQRGVVAVDQHDVRRSRAPRRARAGRATSTPRALRLTIVRRPVPSSTVTAETGGGAVAAVRRRAASPRRRRRSARIRSPSGCAPTAVTSVTVAPSAAAVTAALVAGPPAATSAESGLGLLVHAGQPAPPAAPGPRWPGRRRRRARQARHGRPGPSAIRDERVPCRERSRGGSVGQLGEEDADVAEDARRRRADALGDVRRRPGLVPM